jgi:hypothetical protein
VDIRRLRTLANLAATRKRRDQAPRKRRAGSQNRGASQGCRVHASWPAYVCRPARRAGKTPALVDRLREDLRLTYIPFAQIDFIRVALAKHEVKGKRNSIAYAPGYGRLNQECGSLDYQMEAGRVIIGNISRRDIADSLRALSLRSLPTDEDIKGFDRFINPPDVEF